MKRFIWVFTVLNLFGCHFVSATPPEQKNPKAGESFEMKIGDSHTLGGGNLSFQFDSVPEDSRCARGRVCIWAGNAVVVLKFIDSKESLNTYSKPHEIIKGPYNITLVSLSPYPDGNYTIPQDSYTIQLVVNRN
ncbi:MAG: hypothetical protein ACRER2_18500 [Methylococcales bacterium]